MEGMAEHYKAIQQQQAADQLARQQALINAHGIILRPIDPPSNIIERDPHGNVRLIRHDFTASVFYIPDTPQNAEIKKVLNENDRVSVSSLLPRDIVEQAMQHPGTITFDQLQFEMPTVQSIRVSHHSQSLPRGFDARKACEIDGTAAFNAHASKVMFGKGASPCNDCACNRGPGHKPAIHRQINP
ncbi:hypothetical protein [Micavibrio aeruginosavorus]|uniref:hypothetical protein n=1 Tax=Micavibrio aeruginosavorus TaxID=349221 RepID=UPI003F4AE37C